MPDFPTPPDYDQATAWIADNFPSLWRRIYLKCIEEGFTQSESMEILRAYIMATASPK